MSARRLVEVRNGSDIASPTHLPATFSLSLVVSNNHYSFLNSHLKAGSHAPPASEEGDEKLIQAIIAGH
jgi:hypothetical protein